MISKLTSKTATPVEESVAACTARNAPEDQRFLASVKSAENFVALFALLSVEQFLDLPFEDLDDLLDARLWETDQTYPTLRKRVLSAQRVSGFIRFTKPDEGQHGHFIVADVRIYSSDGAWEPTLIRGIFNSTSLGGSRFELVPAHLDKDTQPE